MLFMKFFMLKFKAVYTEWDVCICSILDIHVEVVHRTERVQGSKRKNVLENKKTTSLILRVWHVFLFYQNTQDNVVTQMQLSKNLTHTPPKKGCYFFGYSLEPLVKLKSTASSNKNGIVKQG